MTIKKSLQFFIAVLLLVSVAWAGSRILSSIPTDQADVAPPASSSLQTAVTAWAGSSSVTNDSSYAPPPQNIGLRQAVCGDGQRFALLECPCLGRGVGVSLR